MYANFSSNLFICICLTLVKLADCVAARCMVAVGPVTGIMSRQHHRCRRSLSVEGGVAACLMASDGLWMSVWTRVAVVALVVWATSSMLRVCCVAARTCQFPAFLQTNTSVDGQTRDWRGRVREQHMETGLRVTVYADIISVESSDDQSTSYVLHCVEILPARDEKDDVKFLVQRVNNVASLPYYTCVQFVRRSPEVVQLQTTPLSDSRPDAAICHAAVDTWHLDPWILIDRAAIVSSGFDHALPCALRGGFSVRMYDRTGHQGACDSRRGETRMEADCEHLAEGTHFYFRHATCIPVGLYMYATQRTLCAANWAAGAYTFTLLRHDRLSYAWLLRFPTKPEDSFTTYLLSDLVAELTDYIAETTNYIRLDTVRDVPRPATSLCLDEHDDACAAWRRPCTSGPQTALECARTCGICNATQPVVCSFPPELIGHWDSGGSDGGLAVEFQQTLLSMKPTSGSQLSTLRCVRWQSPPVTLPTADRFRYISNKMLVAEYADGCRPRYVCARILRKSASVMYIRLSAARVWPLTSSPADPIDCHAFDFDQSNDHRVGEEAVRALQSNHFRLLFSRKSRGAATACRLPSHAFNNYSVTFRDGVECVGSVYEADSKAASLRMTLTACSSPVNRTQYFFDCRESSRLPPSNDRVLIVSSTPTTNWTVVYHCWFFPVAVGVFYLFDAGQCDAVMRGAKPSAPAAGDLLPADQLLVDELTPLAVFSSKSRRTPREEDYPDTVASPASRVHHISKTSLDGRKSFVGAYSNTSVPTSSSSSLLSSGYTSPSVLGASPASLMSSPLSATTSTIILPVVRCTYIILLTANVVT